MMNDIDDAYADRSIAPKFLSLNNYPQNQHGQIHHEAEDEIMSDGSGSPCRSRSVCSEPMDQTYHGYARKSGVMDAGMDQRAYYDFPSPHSQMGYNPTRYSQELAAYSQECYDPYQSAQSSETVRYNFYPGQVGSPQHVSSNGQPRRRPSKKPKSVGGLPLIVSSDDKPHQCSIGPCDARFKRQEHLRRHERTHTAERPYPCDVCDRKFSRTDNLRMHRKTHMKKTGRNIFVEGLCE